MYIATCSKLIYYILCQLNVLLKTSSLKSHAVLSYYLRTGWKHRWIKFWLLLSWRNLLNCNHIFRNPRPYSVREPQFLLYPRLISVRNTTANVGIRNKKLSKNNTISMIRFLKSISFPGSLWVWRQCNLTADLPDG